MKKNIIVVDQALHGYRDGHQLIKQSLNISVEAQQLMLRLSDLSGQNVPKQFEKYYTVYELPNEKKCVISCTWYAHEMKRPGCVWTHSLLVDKSNIPLLGENIEKFMKLFHRPAEWDSYDFSQQLYFEVNSLLGSYNSIDCKKLQYIIWAIWGHEESVIIPVENAQNYFREMMYIWSKYYRYLPEGFSLSTGSFSVRRINDRIFSLQTMPYSIVKSLYDIKNEYVILPLLTQINSFPMWIRESEKILQENKNKAFDEFVDIFDVSDDKAGYFSKFIKMFVAANVDKNLNISKGLEITDKLFNDNRKQYFGRKFIELYTTNDSNQFKFENACSTDALKYIISHDWVEISDEQMEKLVYLNYIEDKNEIMNVINLLLSYEKYKYTEPILSNYARLIAPNEFAGITNLDLKVCCVLIAFRMEYVYCKELWQQSEYFQKEILLSLNDKKVSSENIDKLIKLIVYNSEFILTDELYRLFGYKCINMFWELIFNGNLIDINAMNSLKRICSKHQDICISKLIQHHKELTALNVLNMMDIIKPYRSEITQIDSNIWIRYYKLLKTSDLFSENRLKIMWFYFALILEYNVKFPLGITGEVFVDIHNRLKNQQTPGDEWYNIEHLLPRIEFYNQWDRCKRVRKAMKEKGYKIKDLERYDRELEAHLL